MKKRISGERTELLRGQERSNSLEHFRVHRSRDLAGLRILLARMVHPKQSHTYRRELRFRAMRKRIGCSRRNRASMLKNRQEDVPGDFPERQHRSGLQNPQLALEIRPAVEYFARKRLIL